MASSGDDGIWVMSFQYHFTPIVTYTSLEVRRKVCGAELVSSQSESTLTQL